MLARPVVTFVALATGLASCSSSEVDWPSAKEQSASFATVAAAAEISVEAQLHALDHIAGLVLGVDPESIHFENNQFVLSPLPEQPVKGGLATPIGDGRFLLSAWHVVNDDPNRVVVIGRGKHANYKAIATTFWCQREDDLVVLKVDEPLPVGFALATSARTHDLIWTYGRQSLIGGQITETPTSDAGRHRVLGMTLRGVYGDSGAPILNASSQIVGVIVGYRTRQRHQAFWQRKPIGVAIRPDSAVLNAILTGTATRGSYDAADCVRATASNAKQSAMPITVAMPKTSTPN